jgi:hypothetical protein
LCIGGKVAGCQIWRSIGDEDSDPEMERGISPGEDWEININYVSVTVPKGCYGSSLKGGFVSFLFVLRAQFSEFPTRFCAGGTVPILVFQATERLPNQ